MFRNIFALFEFQSIKSNILKVISNIDGDQTLNDQFNISTVQPSQDKWSKAQELAQIIKDIMAAQIAQNRSHQPGFVSLITQA